MRLATHKPIVSVDAVVGVELLAITLAGKHMARCQQMSTPLHVLLKADPCIKGDLADDKVRSFGVPTT